MRIMAFEKVVLPQVKAEYNKVDGWVLQFLSLKLMEKHAIATEKKSISHNIFGTNRNIFTKICRQRNYKANKVIW